MLDYTKELTHDHIWQDCFLERLTDIFWHLKKPGLLPEGYDIDLDRITPLPNMKAHFSIVASGGRQPLRYDFMAQMAPGLTSFHIMPVDPEFQMYANDFEDGYDMKPVESMFAARIAGDILVNYRDEIKDPFFDPLSARAVATRNWHPAAA